MGAVTDAAFRSYIVVATRVGKTPTGLLQDWCQYQINPTFPEYTLEERGEGLFVEYRSKIVVKGLISTESKWMQQEIDAEKDGILSALRLCYQIDHTKAIKECAGTTELNGKDSSQVTISIGSDDDSSDDEDLGISSTSCFVLDAFCKNNNLIMPGYSRETRHVEPEGNYFKAKIAVGKTNFESEWKKDIREAEADVAFKTYLAITERFKKSPTVLLQEWCQSQENPSKPIYKREIRNRMYCGKILLPNQKTFESKLCRTENEAQKNVIIAALRYCVDSDNAAPVKELEKKREERRELKKKNIIKTVTTSTSTSTSTSE